MFYFVMPSIVPVPDLPLGKVGTCLQASEKTGHTIVR